MSWDFVDLKEYVPRKKMYGGSRQFKDQISPGGIGVNIDQLTMAKNRQHFNRKITQYGGHSRQFIDMTNFPSSFRGRGRGVRKDRQFYDINGFIGRGRQFSDMANIGHLNLKQRGRGFKQSTERGYVQTPLSVI